MAFLRKSTSKLIGLSRKASNGAAVDQARAASQARAEARSKTPSNEMLQKAWEKLEKTNPPTGKVSQSSQTSDGSTQDLDLPESDISELDIKAEIDTKSDMRFVADNLKSYEAPEFRANIKNSNDHIDVTPELSAQYDRESDDMGLNAPEPSALDSDSDAFDLGLQPVIPRSARADVSSMRLDVARISADIQSGEELYRRAQQRIENLTSFVERADIDFSLLNRLEPENRRLKARNRTVETELDEKQRALSILQIDLDDHRKRLAERNAGFEAAQSKLSIAKKSLQTYERTLQDVQQKLDKSDLSQERIQTALEVERRENEMLRERVTDMSTELDSKQSFYLEAKKMADSLMQDCNDFRQSADTANKANIELRDALYAAQKQNNAMKGEMISLHEDIRSFKTQYEFNVISREDEITAMQNQIATLKKQLEVKDEIVRNAARDVTELRKIRTAQDLERERLEAQIQSQAFQLDEVNSKLSQSQQDVSEFDRRYRDVATALSVTQARRASSIPAQTPDIQPPADYAPRAEADMAPPLASIPTAMQPAAKPQQNPINSDTLSGESSPVVRSTKAMDEYDDLTDDDIINRITEFKLGLRKDIG